MKKLLSFLLLSLFLLFSSYTPFGQEQDQKNTLLLEVVLSVLNDYHFEPRQIDDQFSAQVFDEFLERLDNSKRFLLASDIKQLRAYREKVDDQLKAREFTLYETALDLITKRMAEVADYHAELLDEPFHFEREERYQTDPDKINYARDQKELRERWRQLLKYQTLARMARDVQRQEEAQEKGDTTVEIKDMVALEAKAREEVRKAYRETFRRLGQLEPRDWYTAYLNSILATYDPHTGYFPPEEKENFDISISGQLEGIGASLSERDGFIKVERIVPGSASWRQGELKEGDIILKVGQSEEEAVDVVDMRLDQAVQMIRGPKGTEVRLTVKKIDGTTQVIPITRDIVVLEETYAQSAVLEEGGRKVGYINLPKFYADFNRNGGRSSAADVKQELIKLKQQDVSGVVLDLRNNGGGSLRDVIEMAGLFIKEGPIVQVKGRDYQRRSANDGDGYAYKVEYDTDSAVVYDGPLVIMVNTFSASASEILAAAMQDYGRALVVGNASFGKGTVQRFIDLDRLVRPQHDAFKPLGSIKLTTQKFYRINGDATQLKGVTPDIVLPDNYTFLDVGEREQEYAMAWDEIRSARYEPFGEYATHFGQVISRSNNRVGDNDFFEKTTDNAKRLKRLRERTEVSLQFDGYLTEQKRLQEEAEQYQSLQTATSLGVAALDDLLRSAPADTVTRDRTDRWVKGIGKDVYVAESFRVLGDINL
ncbi:MAG: carboxy terminal-processing peptidase [Catalinimonas sp.]